MGSDDGRHAHDLAHARQEKDAWFKLSPHSPLSPEERARFKGLRYFDPDPALRVRARFEPAKGHRHAQVGTSTGETRDYHVAGTLRFAVGGIEQTLTGYVSHGHEDEMFVPFRDATSGKESYGAARYLEVPYPEGGEATIDFNLAYNPYCAYEESYSCPLPPRENWLTVPIRAGERAYKDD